MDRVAVVVLVAADIAVTDGRMVVPAPALSPECDTTIPLIIVVCCNEVEIPVVELASDGAGAPVGARCGC